MGYFSNQSTMKDCYATGAVTGAGTYVGGVAGYVGGYSNNASVVNCYATGVVKGGNTVGGVVGYVYGNVYVGAVYNCVALNPSVTGVGSGRVVGSSDGGTLTNNYASNGMAVYTNATTQKTIDAGPDKIDGADITKAQAITPAFWTTPGNWDTSAWDTTTVWDIAADRLPLLKGLAGQNGDTGLYLTQQDLQFATVTVPTSPLTYTGSAQTPALAVTFDGATLTVDKDYTITAYADNTDAGTATVTIAGMGNYVGTGSASFTIGKAPLTVTAATHTKVYDGTTTATGVTVTLGGVLGGDDVDADTVTAAYNSKDVGTSPTMTVSAVTLTGAKAGNYAVTVPADSVPVTAGMTPKAIDDGSVTVDAISAQAETGSAVTPDPIVKDGAATLVKDTDYTLGYSNNIAVGTATVTISGTGNYTGSRNAGFTIEQTIVNVTGAVIAPKVYDGTADIDPADIQLTFNAAIGSDYEITDAMYTGAGAADAGNGKPTTFTVALTGAAAAAYTLPQTVFTNITADITPKPLAGLTLSVTPTKAYTGGLIAPEVTVTDGAATLSAGTDYDVAIISADNGSSASAGINAGTVTFTVTGKGNYTGVETKTYEITAKPVSITGAAIAPKVYDGMAGIAAAAVTPTFDATLTAADYAVQNAAYTGADAAQAGTDKATMFEIVLKGSALRNFSLSNSPYSLATAGITPRAITDNGIAYKKTASLVYTGQAIAPPVSLRYGSVTLVEGMDYQLAITSTDDGAAASAGTNAGTVSFTVMGMGNFAGTKTDSFDITKATLSITGAAIASKVYDGTAAIDPAAIDVTFNMTTLTAADYTVQDAMYTGAGAAKAGTGKATTFTVVLQGDAVGNYSFNRPTYRNAKADITPKPLDGFAVAAIANQTYTGGQIQPALTVSDGAQTLRSGTEYSVVYSDNIDAGTATFEVAGTGNYSGTLAGSFVIDRRVIRIHTNGSAVAAKTYDGTTDADITHVAFAGVASGQSLEKGIDYTVTDARYNDANVAAANTVTATVALVADGPLAKNYTLDDGAFVRAVKIGKAAASGVAQRLQVKSYIARAYTFDLTTLLPSEVAPAQVSAYRIISGARNAVFAGDAVISGHELTVSMASAAEGDQAATLTIGFTSGNYAIESTTVTIDIQKRNPVIITGVAVPGRAYNGAAITVIGTPVFTDTINQTTMQLTPVYTWADEDGPLPGAPIDAGRYTLTVTADAGEDHLVTPLVIAFDVAKANQTIIFPAPATDRAGTTQTLRATADSGLPVSYTSDNTQVAEVLGNVLHRRAEGTTYVTAQQAGNHNYNAAPPVSQTISVLKAVSGDATLASLRVSAGTLTPWFSASVNQYSVLVGGDVTDIHILATPSHNGAAVWGDGNHALVAGANTITVMVTAEDGTMQNYIITVVRPGAGGGTAAQEGQWLEVQPAANLYDEAKTDGRSYARTSRTGIYGVRGASWARLAGLRYEHDTMDGGAVQVRVYIDNPAVFGKDMLLSGHVKGADVDRIDSLFERFFSNRIQVIHLDQKDDWAQPVRVAAKVDLSGMNVANLYFYGYDEKTNTYRRIENPAHAMDANGFLHFTTPYGGDIILSDGPLMRR